MTDQTNTTSGAILIVDDTPANLSLLADILSTSGYTVTEALDGPAALEIVHTTPPDLILLDIWMPGMDGYQVCQHLKNDESTHDIPVIFISALSDVDGIVRAFDVGGVDYITKPVKMKEVLARVASQLTLVHQRRQIVELREQDRQYFKSLDNMKNEFIRMATHDLRNPLNIITGYADLLKEVTVAEKDAYILERAIEGVESSVDKMRTLVTDLLDLIQVEMRTDLTLVPVRLASFLEICLSGFYLVATAKHVQLLYDPPDPELTLNLDSSRMERVVDNLVSNAIKYTPPGGEVKVTLQADNDHVILLFSDTGLGIPAEDIPHLFDAFYRVKLESHWQQEGTGLGLSVVKAVVEQHGGEVSVESELGEGSVFKVKLPKPS
ncbi:MAG: hybrid sensor histidine kinase/response regulator [Anaerolineae bacterium]|nr:hybrid sensor histidine kinase/response regulator [Anaerolineae bacterium]